MTHEQICHISEIRPTVRHKSRLACLILQKRTSTAHFQYSSCPILEKRTSATHVRRITCPIHQKRTTETRFCLCTCPILQNRTLMRHNDGLGQAVAAICPRSSAFARSSSSIRRACCLMMMLAVPTSMPSSLCALTGIYSIGLLVMLSRLRLITNACSYRLTSCAMISLSLMLPLPVTDLMADVFQRSTHRSMRLYPMRSGGSPASRKILVGDSPVK